MSTKSTFSSKVYIFIKTKCNFRLSVQKCTESQRTEAGNVAYQDGLFLHILINMAIWSFGSDTHSKLLVCLL